ncbi:lipoprotein [Arvimicrobium flavum]|uniref:lipoprotein n=1 Tax=Arvimicrobium flavum TaxID=3393320 RepID=UPI00237C20B8|nr:lipoprotein [Mesorhizobium shangrilense]
MTASRFVLSAVLIAAFGLAACGRKSDLITPYEAQLEARREAEKAGQPVPPAPEKPVADKPFILDRLID